MQGQTDFICRKRKGKYFQDTTWIAGNRMPYFSSAMISLYACGETELLPGYRQKPARMAYWSVEYIAAGDYTVVTGENRYQLKAGEILIHYPGVTYSRMNLGSVPVRKKEIMLNNSPLISILCNRSVLNGRESVLCRNPKTIEAYFDRVRELVSAPGPIENPERVLANTVFALFTEIIGQCGEETNIGNSFDDRLRQLDLFSPDLTLDKMAAQFKTGQRTLNRMFMKQLNLSPFQYVIAMRMKYAAQLLNSNSLSIRNVAEECGYRNTSFFIAEFKKYFQQTPLEYRNGADIFNNGKIHLLDGWNRKPKEGKTRRIRPAKRPRKDISDPPQN